MKIDVPVNDEEISSEVMDSAIDTGVVKRSGSRILSFGGGLQTAAMVCALKKELFKHPDAVIAADTGREMPTTWEYAEKYMRPLLKSIGLELHIAPHSLATVDLYALNGDLTMPAYTKGGKLPTFCSNEWKRRVVERYARTELKLPKPYVNLIGFSLDERRRVSGSTEQEYPLIALSMTRQDCINLILSEGLPLPSKSRCWMCPHQNNEEWRQVRSYPDIWEKAVAIDMEVRDADDRGGLWLHEQRVPLDQVELDSSDRKEPSRQCGLGYCFI